MRSVDRVIPIFSMLVMLCCALANASASAQEIPQPFLATYGVEWRGMGAGTSTIELTKTAPDTFRYQSRNAARGLFRIALPDTITQTSELSIVDGKVMPKHFSADDGSSNTERDVDLRFDWDAHQITGTAEDAAGQRASSMKACKTPVPFRSR